MNNDGYWEPAWEMSRADIAQLPGADFAANYSHKISHSQDGVFRTTIFTNPLTLQTTVVSVNTWTDTPVHTDNGYFFSDIYDGSGEDSGYNSREIRKENRKERPKHIPGRHTYGDYNCEWPTNTGSINNKHSGGRIPITWCNLSIIIKQYIYDWIQWKQEEPEVFNLNTGETDQDTIFTTLVIGVIVIILVVWIISTTVSHILL